MPFMLDDPNVFFRLLYKKCRMQPTPCGLLYGLIASSSSTSVVLNWKRKKEYVFPKLKFTAYNHNDLDLPFQAMLVQNSGTRVARELQLESNTFCGLAKN